MSVIKALIGGLIGAAIAVAILTWLRADSPNGYTWFPIITGLLTGIGAMLLGGKSYGTTAVIAGALSAIIALVAIALGTDAMVMLNQKTVDLGPIITSEEADERADVAKEKAEADGDADADDNVDADSDDGADADDDAAGGAAVVDANTPVRDPKMAESASAAERSARNASTSDVTREPPAKVEKTDIAKYIYSGIGVLLAYQLGRGFGSGNRVTRRPEDDDVVRDGNPDRVVV